VRVKRGRDRYQRLDRRPAPICHRRALPAEADEDVEEHGVEAGAEQAEGDDAPAAPLAAGRPRRGRPSRRSA
jgi:hypothetical protein